ncbi:44785_t:CDS:2, partial [Gigaspora margarita]
INPRRPKSNPQNQRAPLFKYSSNLTAVSTDALRKGVENYAKREDEIKAFADAFQKSSTLEDLLITDNGIDFEGGEDLAKHMEWNDLIYQPDEPDEFNEI